MAGGRFSLFYIQNRAFKVFNKEKKQNRHTSKKLLDKAFPTIPVFQNGYINVKGEKSPYDGDLTYWSKRNSKLYDGTTSKVLKSPKTTKLFMCQMRIKNYIRGASSLAPQRWKSPQLET